MQKIQTTTTFSHQILEESNNAIKAESQMLRTTRRRLAGGYLDRGFNIPAERRWFEVRGQQIRNWKEYTKTENLDLTDREIMYFDKLNSYEEEKSNAIHDLYYELQNYDDITWEGRNNGKLREFVDPWKGTEGEQEFDLVRTKDWNWTRMDEAQALHDHCYEGVNEAVGDKNFEILQAIAKGLKGTAENTGEQCARDYAGEANNAHQYVNDIIHEMTDTAKGTDKLMNEVQNQDTWLQARQEDFLKDLLLEENGGEFTWEEWQDFADTFNIRNELMQGQWLMVVIGAILGLVILCSIAPFLCGKKH